MKNAILTLAIAIAVGFLTAAPASAQPQQVITPPKIKTGVAPKYDGIARQTFREGWVFYKFMVTKEGVIQNPTVIESYPKGMFDAEALRALETWTYNPKTVNGVPVDEPDHRVALLFAMDVERGVTEAYYDDFRRAVAAARKDESEQTEKYVGRLKKAFDEGKFNLTEVARYYQLEGMRAIGKQDMVGAAKWVELALRLAQYLDNKGVVDNLHTQMIVAFIGLTQYHNAVDYYDSWVREAGLPKTEKLIQAIAQFRIGGYGQGRVFEIATYKEALQKGRDSKPKGGRVGTDNKNEEKEEEKESN